MTHRGRCLFGGIDPQLTRSHPEIHAQDPSSQWIHLNDSDSDLSQDLASPVIRTQIRDNPEVRPGPNVVRSLSFELPRVPPIPPTQAILDSSPDSGPSSPDLFEEADLERGFEERDSPIIETLSSEGGAGGWATPKKDHEPDPCPAPNTSTKKRKKKFGLASKLDLVWRENQTDRLLKTHIRGNSSTSTCTQSTSDTDLCLFIDHVTNYRAFKNLTCHCSIQSDKIYQVTIQPADLPQIPLECLVSGTEIRIPAPFYSSSRLSGNNSDQVIFGIQRLEILDQTVIKVTPESTLFTWHCTCIDSDPIQIDQE